MRISLLPLVALSSSVALPQGTSQLLPPDFEDVVALNHDGSVVVGYETISSQGFFQTRGVVVASGGAPADLEDSPGFDSSLPRAISSDGQVIVGMLVSSVTYDRLPARWDLAGNVSPIGNFLGFYDVQGVSDDGSYTVGSSSDEAVRWRLTEDEEVLDGLSSAVWSLAYDANVDGSVIVGSWRNAAGDVLPFRWVEGAGATTLPLLPGHTNATARYVSADGDTVIGTSYISIAAAKVVWLWTAAEGIRAFPVTAGAPDRFSLNGATASFDRVVGWRPTVSPVEERSTVMDVDRPVASYLDFAAAREIPPIAGATYYRAAAVSGDGHVLAGIGVDAGGGLFAWIATEGWEFAIQASTCAHGVANQTGGVSTLQLDGLRLAGANDISLRAMDLPPGVITMFLTSLDAVPPVVPPGSIGAICLGGSVGRYNRPTQIQLVDSLGMASLKIDLTETPTAVGPAQVLAGERWHYQAWHRDLFQGQATSNFTDAVHLLFQ